MSSYVDQSCATYRLGDSCCDHAVSAITTRVVSVSVTSDL